MRFLKINQVHQPGGKAKYRTYSPTALTRAYSAIMVDKLSIRRASKFYGVPFQTLRDRVTGNVDPECWCNHQPQPSKVVSGVETSSQEVTSGKGDTVTILGCGNAIGNALPPYFVFPGQRINDQLLEGSTPGTVGTVSKTRRSNSELFMDFLSNHFKKFVPGNGHVMLLLDGHKSHVAVSTIEWARRHNIVIQLLPAHTSHLLQPLDVGCYGPLQNIYNSLCHRTIRTKQCALTRYDVYSMACKAYGNALSVSNLQSALRKTGIYPFTKDIINDLPLTP
ncbi:unnamed protein product [Mytilus coruscus]|uniref:DDE-1 domain-containing protein n=1 Tax=Mytilus coruscus TaxID=42192 RepID=A0A6J8AX25_MYTCO|nr:unnamed protein product [Mytilus coruscus]